MNQELNDFEDRPVPRPRALVALGGQLGGFAGFLPGVAEEIAVALEAGIAVYVLGGLGGAAGASAGLVRGEKVPELTQKAFLKSERYRALRMAARKRGRAGELRKRLHWMEKVFRNARRQGFRNGLSSEENEELMRTTHFGRALTLISRGLRLISAGADKRGRAKRE